jgi:recombination protein RecT
MSGEIVKSETKYGAIKNFLESPNAMQAIERALPNHLDSGKMLQVVLTAITKTPKLLQCEPPTIAKAVLEASQLGLMPDGVLGHGYLVPYGKTCTFIPGYRGLIDLARRSGQVDSIQARVVKEGDEFDFAYGAEPFLTHRPAQMVGNTPGATLAAYAIAKLKSGEVAFDVMFWNDIQKIRKRSKAGGTGPWVTDTDEMSKKTVLRRLCKYLPLSADVTAAVTKDEYAERGLLGTLGIGEAEVPVAEEKDALGDLFPDDEAIDVEGEVVEDEVDDDPPVEQRAGRITNEEDEKFDAAIESLKERACMIDDGMGAYGKALGRLMGAMGVEAITEIRNREKRMEFYNDLKSWVEDFESMHEEG